jgi:cysteine synthase A|tara:strand:- start:131 stop:976 length:846 start_codon:yes stop_codon:yes gene_type:complete
LENLIGNTPLVEVADKIYAKLETYNPSGSIKDRMAYFILSWAKQRGELQPGDTIVEATSGNTGIAMSMLGAAMGHSVIIIMPRNMSNERKCMMRTYGAEIIEVGDNAFKDAIKLRDEMCKENKSYFNPRQFSNPDNVWCHKFTTGPEIIKEMPQLSAFIAGSGTGGTLMGVNEALKTQNIQAKIVQVQPEESNATHGIQGINDGEDFLLDKNIVDETIYIKTDDAVKRAKKLAKENGLLVGISSGANVLAAEKWVEKNNPEHPVVTILCDRGERYFSCYED